MPDTATQTINILVERPGGGTTPPITPPGVPNTDTDGSVLTALGSIKDYLTSNVWLVIALSVLIVAIAIATLLIAKHHRKQSLTIKTNKVNRKWLKPATAIMSVITIAVLAASHIAPVKAADPLITADTGPINITILEGSTGTTSASTTSTVTIESDTYGYILDAYASGNDTPIGTSGLTTNTLLGNGKIALDLSSEDTIPPITNETVSADSLSPTFLTDTGTATSTAGDTLTFELTVTVDNTLPAGMYEVDLFYNAELNLVPQTMQQMTAAYCADTNNMVVGNIITLEDERDRTSGAVGTGTMYRIRKMEDNKCWMIDNLALELTPGMTLTSADSNVATDTTVWFTQDGTQGGVPLAGMPGGSNFTTSGWLTVDNSSATGANLSAWRQVDPSNTINCSNGTAFNAASNTGCGYLYNWYTATAGTGNYNIYGGTTGASASICPANWSLPTGSGNIMIGFANRDFGLLNSMMFNAANPGATNNTNYSAAPRPANWLQGGLWQGTLSGNYYSGFSNKGSIGMYWSSIGGASSGRASILTIATGSVEPGTDRGSGDGMAARCLL